MLLFTVYKTTDDDDDERLLHCPVIMLLCCYNEYNIHNIIIFVCKIINFNDTIYDFASLARSSAGHVASHRCHATTLSTSRVMRTCLYASYKLVYLCINLVMMSCIGKNYMSADTYIIIISRSSPVYLLSAVLV
jgi:hypothetical protein